MEKTHFNLKQFDSLFSSKYDNFFSTLFKASTIFNDDETYNQPPKYIFEEKDALIIYIDVPGYKKDDINISYTAGLNLSYKVEVTGTRTDIKNRTLKLCSSFYIDSKYDIKTLEVKHEDGVLKFKAQKRKDTIQSPVKVDIT